MHVPLEFAARAALCTDLAELGSMLDAVSNELGFHHFALVHHVTFERADPQFISIDNYPEAWAEEFVGQQLFLDDPVLAASTRTNKGFRWADVAELLPIREKHRQVIERSRRYGMGQGFTIPANVPGEPIGSCSFAVKPGKALCEKNVRCAELIGIDAFAAARRLHRLPACDTPRHLSPRERQCVQLAVGGASDKTIARRLGLSPETTRLYLKTARAAYGVDTRTGLVARALRDGQVNFLKD